MIVLTPVTPRFPKQSAAPRVFPEFVPLMPRTTSAAWAVAMLMGLLAAISLVLFSPDQAGEQGVAPVILPALSGTPEHSEATPASHIPGVSLLHLDLPESSADRAFVSLERYTLPQAASMEMDVRVGNTPLVSYLVTGVVQAQLDAAAPSARIVRAGGKAREEELTAGGTVALTAGDAFVVPEQGLATVTNESTGPAEVLLLFQPTGVPAILATAGDFATMGTQVHTIRTPLTLDLYQETLAPGSAIAPSADPQVVQITGSLDPDHVMDVRTASGGALRNAGEAPLGVYVLTVTSDVSRP